MISKTVIDFSDTHTTLGSLARRRLPLPIGTAKSYSDLGARLWNHREDHEKMGIKASEVMRPAPPPDAPALRIIRGLRPAWGYDKYWLYAFKQQTDPADYAKLAWERFAPILATHNVRVECLPEGLDCRVATLVRVLIFPTGWSTQVSLQVTVDHSLETLAALASQVMSRRILRIKGEPMMLAEVFDHFGKAVSDLFLPGCKISRHFEPLVVTTVIARGTEELFAAGLGAGSAGASIRRLVRPSGTLPREEIRKLVRAKSTGNPEQDFIVVDENGVFIWLRDLLRGRPADLERMGTDADHLRCYHNNTTLSLITARQQRGLLRAALQESKKPSALTVVAVGNAISRLEAAAAARKGYDAYSCLALRDYASSAPVVEDIAAAKALLPKQEGASGAGDVTAPRDRH